jgi:cytidine deaminase
MSSCASERDVQRLITAANAAKENSYSPYSHFRVGAALLCKDGSIFAGTKVENAAYPSGCCAERAAIVTAVSAGYREFAAILVVSDDEKEFITPCGFCRQCIVEFGNLEVILTKGTERLRTTIAELLPRAFTPASLNTG